MSTQLPAYPRLLIATECKLIDTKNGVRLKEPKGFEATDSLLTAGERRRAVVHFLPGPCARDLPFRRRPYDGSGRWIGVIQFPGLKLGCAAIPATGSDLLADGSRPGAAGRASAAEGQVKTVRRLSTLGTVCSKPVVQICPGWSAMWHHFHQSEHPPKTEIAIGWSPLTARAPSDTFINRAKGAFEISIPKRLIAANRA